MPHYYYKTRKTRYPTMEDVRHYQRGVRSTTTAAEKSRYETLNTLRDRRGRPMGKIDPDRETPMEMLRRAGWQDNEIEGGSRDDHEGFFQDLLRTHAWIRRVVEIGFNAGVSSDIFLGARPDIRVLSFDIMWHPYSTYANMYIQSKYQGRHMLVAGDSAETIPSYIEEHILPRKIASDEVVPAGFRPYDLIFIDGDHTYERARADIINMRYFAGPDTIVVIDNVAPHRGCSEQVYRAYRDLWQAGLLYHDRHVEVSIQKNGQQLTYHDGFVVCRYRQYAYTERAGDPDWRRMERRVRTTDIARRMKIADTRKELDELYRQAREFEKEDGPDPYVDADYRTYRDAMDHKKGGWSTSPE